MNYIPPSAKNSWDVINAGEKAFISRYALGRDYHKVLRARLKKLADKLTIEACPGCISYLTIELKGSIPEFLDL